MAQQQADALALLAETALHHGIDPGAPGERYQIVVHVDATHGKSVLEEGGSLSEETSKRLACDASLVQLVEKDGEPLSVGRKTRTVPPSIRRALQARDRRCRFPGCDNRRFLDAHHIEHWAAGGETKLGNLVLLCGRHHRYLHEGGYSIAELAGGALEFRDPWGNRIEPVPRPPPGDPERLLAGNELLEIDGKTCACGDGDRMDLDLTVAALMQLVDRPLAT
jgi:hypothetical protein